MRRRSILALLALSLAATAASADDYPADGGNAEPIEVPVEAPEASAAGVEETAEASAAGVEETAGAGGGQPTGMRDWRWWLDNEFYGLSLNVRPRFELANQDGKDFAQAYTVRTLLGLGTKPWHGLSAFVQMEGTFSFDHSAYFDGVRTGGRSQTQISDPEFVELNQGYAQYANPELFGLRLRGGREGINYDDQRWVGTVFWRQNEQSFDSASGVTSLGIDGLDLGYAYFWHINRIFADKGTSSTEDYDSDSHFVRIHYDGIESLEATAFAYFMDFENDSPGNSANSYGFRVDGSRKLGKDWKAFYTASYAFQTDAGKNPVDYDAHYAWVSGALAYLPIAKLGVGYEHLGSDDGKARVVTPLATGHKFNGFADVFLDNGGNNGLRDLFVTLSPTMPWGVKGSVIFHQFWSDQGGNDLGWEFNMVASRPFGEHATVLTKAAWYDGSNQGRDDIWRYWLQVTFDF